MKKLLAVFVALLILTGSKFVYLSSVQAQMSQTIVGQSQFPTPAGRWLVIEGGSATSALDSSVHGNNGTWTGTKSCSSSYYTTGFSPFTYSGCLDGSTNYVSIPDSTSLQFGTGSFTASIWVYATAFKNTNSTSNVLLSKNYTGFEIYFYKFGGTVSAYMGGTSNPINGTFTLATSTLYHVVLSRIGSAATLYVNGVSVGTATNSASVSNAGTAIEIGNRTGSAISSFGFSGDMGSAEMWNVGFTASQVKALYLAGPSA